MKFEPNLEKPFTGKHVTHYANGKKMSETSYKEGRIDGLWTWWYEMRSKMEEEILQGHEERGAVDFRYRNEKKWKEGNYNDDDEKNGRWTSWDWDGNVAKTETYRNGELIN
ncbi:MAG: hypothetical protein KAG66_20590 [Methylococcales bacterium]|nr:hypothetical protein [Methylococcales bacterium]